GESFVSTKHRDAEPDTFDPNKPRLGRRESEPHSAEITYLYDVLTTNFPDDRTMWDLHHYFKKETTKIDVQFDISYFRGLKIPFTLSSYRADDFNKKVPTMAINILSKSTWRSDIAEKADFCRILEIPIYIVFPPYNVTINIYKPPYLRVYILQENGEYKMHELRETLGITSGQWNKDYILQENGEYKMHELRETLGITSGQWNKDAVIDVSHIVPFRLGLRKRKQRHHGDKSLYRLVLIDPESDKILPTESEKKDEVIEKKDKKIAKLEEENKKLRKQLKKSTN
ncbi:MAG: hypothetical protein ACOC44_20690, partial [Promethearchaeia archaeon]